MNTRTCLECPSTATVRHLCSTHYVAAKREGRLDEYPLLESTLRARERALGETWVNKDGYVLVKIKGGCRAQHRIVMEEMLGRDLVKGESVHHRNGDRSDNRPENLELWRSQPYGQRVEELLQYVATYHAEAIRALLP